MSIFENKLLTESILKNSFLYLVSLLFLFLLLNLQEALANQTISGQVSVEGNRNVSKIVIYLESKTNTYSKPPSAHIIEQRRLKFVPSLKIIVKVSVLVSGSLMARPNL